jgi:hypothetical protein
MSSRDRTLRHCGNTTSAGTQPISPSGHFAHFAPVNGLSNQAPGRQPASRLRAPCASIIAFDPRGRCSCKLVREYRTSGTGTSLIAAKRSFAEPWRPSIHSTSARAKSGTSRPVARSTLAAGVPGRRRRRARGQRTSRRPRRRAQGRAHDSEEIFHPARIAQFVAALPQRLDPGRDYARPARFSAWRRYHDFEAPLLGGERVQVELLVGQEHHRDAPSCKNMSTRSAAITKRRPCTLRAAMLDSTIHPITATASPKGMPTIS